MTFNELGIIVARNTILKCIVGSEAYGLNIDEGAGSDTDELGVCVEPLELFGGFNKFEQYTFRSAEERTGRADARSEAGDLDLKVYSLQKFLRLALSGNPSVIELFFIKEPTIQTAFGLQLQEMAPHIISKRCGTAFLGYMHSQSLRLAGGLGQKGVNRPELVAKYGFDTKYAMHILRVGLQGMELLATGRLTLPLPDDTRTYLKGVRTGKKSLQAVLLRAGELERELRDLVQSTTLPSTPNTELVEKWMIERYWHWWKAQRVLQDRMIPEHIM